MIPVYINGIGRRLGLVHACPDCGNAPECNGKPERGENDLYVSLVCCGREVYAPSHFACRRWNEMVEAQG